MIVWNSIEENEGKTIIFLLLKSLLCICEYKTVPGSFFFLNSLVLVMLFSIWSIHMKIVGKIRKK